MDNMFSFVKMKLSKESGYAGIVRNHIIQLFSRFSQGHSHYYYSALKTRRCGSTGIPREVTF